MKEYLGKVLSFIVAIFIYTVIFTFIVGGIIKLFDMEGIIVFRLILTIYIIMVFIIGIATFENMIIFLLTLIIFLLLINNKVNIIDRIIEFDSRLTNQQSKPISYSKDYTDYKTYDTNIKYSANNDLMNEFLNQVEMKEKKVVIVGAKMWERKLNLKENKNEESIPDNPFDKVIYKNSGSKLIWKEANNYCNDLIIENFDDWRLPTKSELGEYYRSGIKAVDDKSMIFWSSTKSSDKSYDYQGISFDGKGWNIVKSETEYVICVREL